MKETINIIMNQVAHKNISNLETQDNTYIGDDGLLYCNIRNEPIQNIRVNPLKGHNFIVARDCLCERTRKKNIEELRKKKDEQELFKSRQIECFGDSKLMYSFTFENSLGTAETQTYAKRLAEHFEEYKDTNAGVLFWGPSRKTKTYTACSIANDIMKRGFSAKLIKLLDIIMDVFKEMDKNKFLGELHKYDLLIIG